MEKDISYWVYGDEARLTNKYWYRIATIYHGREPKITLTIK